MTHPLVVAKLNGDCQCGRRCPFHHAPTEGQNIHPCVYCCTSISSGKRYCSRPNSRLRLWVQATSLFSFVGFMIEDMGIAKEETEVGYYAGQFDPPCSDAFCISTGAGVLASSYYVAILATTWMWGSMSDKYGRRPMMLLRCAARPSQSFPPVSFLIAVDWYCV